MPMCHIHQPSEISDRIHEDIRTLCQYQSATYCSVYVDRASGDHFALCTFKYSIDADFLQRCCVQKGRSVTPLVVATDVNT